MILLSIWKTVKYSKVQLHLQIKGMNNANDLLNFIRKTKNQKMLRYIKRFSSNFF